MLYFSRLVGRCLLHVLLVWIRFAKISKLSSLCVTFILLVGGHNRQRPCGKPNVIPPDLVVAVDPALWPGLLFLNYAPT